MSHYAIELFGHIAYSPDLSYDDLLAREEETKSVVQAVLGVAGADFIHFEALGDVLRFQCLLPEEKDDVFHTICDSLAPHVKNGLDARILLVDKDLDTVYYYTLANGRWQEAIVGLPPSGYLAETAPVNVGRVPAAPLTSERKPEKKK